MDHQALAQPLGNYGEFVGAIAVVITLVFVGIQVRQSTRTMVESNKLAQSTTLDESLRHFSQFRRMLATDPGLMGRGVYADNAVRSWATQLKQYPGLREIILRPEFDETVFNSSIAKLLEELD